MYMQAQNKDGTHGEILTYTREGLSELLANNNVEYVKVLNTNVIRTL